MRLSQCALSRAAVSNTLLAANHHGANRHLTTCQRRSEIPSAYGRDNEIPARRNATPLLFPGRRAGDAVETWSLGRSPITSGVPPFKFLCPSEQRRQSSSQRASFSSCSAPQAESHETHHISAHDGPTARISTSDEGNSKLELTIHVGDLSEYSVPALEAYKLEDGNTTLRLEINPVRNNSHTRYASRRAKSDLPDTMAASDWTNKEEIFEPWRTALRFLEQNTQEPAADWVNVTVSGTEFDLVESYHYALSMFPNRAFPEPPLVMEGHGTMNIMAEKDCTCEMQRRHVKSGTEMEPEAKNGDIQVRRYPTNSTKVIAAQALAPADFGLTFRLPRKWSTATLLSYVKRITHVKRPRLLYPGEHSKDWIAMALVHVLFDSPLSRPFVSWAALHRALQFLVEQRKEPETRQFMSRMSEVGFAPNVEFFNVRLQGCAKSKEYAAFNQLLHEMSARGILPNGGTWAALYAAAPTMRSGRYVASLLFKRGYLHGRLWTPDNSRQLISVSLGRFLDSGGHMKAYLQILDNLFGPEWNNGEARRALINGLGDRLRMLEAVELAQQLTSAKKHIAEPPGRICLQTLLIHCARHGNADLAVWLVIYANQQWNVRPENRIVLDLLFRTAWRSRMYNLCRVVWKYAIATGQAGPEIRNLVYQSLVTRLDTASSRTVRREWKASFGVVICQADPLSDATLTPKSILDHERDAFRTDLLLQPFTIMIAQALVLDKAWSAQGVKRTTSTEWKVANAIRLPLKRTDGEAQTVS